MKSDMIKNRGFNEWEGIPITNNLTAELLPYVQSMNLLDQEMHEIALLALRTRAVGYDTVKSIRDGTGAYTKTLAVFRKLQMCGIELPSYIAAA